MVEGRGKKSEVVEGRVGGNRREGEPGCPLANIVAVGNEDWEKGEGRGEGKGGIFWFGFYFWKGPVRFANWGGDRGSTWLGERQGWASERGGDSPRKCWRFPRLLGTGRSPGLGYRGRKGRTSHDRTQHATYLASIHGSSPTHGRSNSSCLVMGR